MPSEPHQGRLGATIHLASNTTCRPRQVPEHWRPYWLQHLRRASDLTSHRAQMELLADDLNGDWPLVAMQ
jgi:hypothetical protein